MQMQLIIVPLSCISSRPRSLRAMASILPRGTVVYHGTTARHLPSILINGLQPSGRAPATRRVELGGSTTVLHIPEQSPAVFVAGMRKATAFAGAAAAGLHGDPGPLDLPIVLELELGEDCGMLTDPDNSLDASATVSAKCSWDRFQSASVTGPIPTSWIHAAHVATATEDGLIESDTKQLALAHVAYNLHVAPYEETALGLSQLEESWMGASPWRYPPPPSSQTPLSSPPLRKQVLSQHYTPSEFVELARVMEEPAGLGLQSWHGGPPQMHRKTVQMLVCAGSKTLPLFLRIEELLQHSYIHGHISDELELVLEFSKIALEEAHRRADISCQTSWLSGNQVVCM